MSTLIIKLYEANTDRILHVLHDELERDSIVAYHLLIEDGTPLDPTDGSPHLAPERDEAMLYAAAPELMESLQAIVGKGIVGLPERYDDLTTVQIDVLVKAIWNGRAAIAKATKP